MRAASSGDYETAVNRLGVYLGRYPNDVQAIVEYAHCRPLVESPNNQHLADTIRALRFLLRLEPARLDEQRQLMRLYQQTGYITEAIDTANAVLSLKANDAEAYGVIANSLVRLRRFPEATDTAAKWINANAGGAEPKMVRLFTMKQANKRDEEIVALANAWLKADPEDPRLELCAAYASAMANDSPRAVKLLQSAASKPLPDDDKFPELLIRQLDEFKLNDESLSVLSRIAGGGHDPKIRGDLIKRLWELNRSEEVVTLLQDVPDDSKSLSSDEVAIRIACLLQTGHNDQAAKVQKALARRDKDPIAIAWNLVLSQVIAGGNIDPKSLFSACQAALEKDPDDAYMRYFLGESELRLQEYDMAVSIWQKTVADNLTWSQPATRLAGLLLDTGRIQSGLAMAEEAARRAPASANGAAIVTLLRARAMSLEVGGYQQADELLKQIEYVQQVAPNEEETLSIRVGLLTRTGRKDEAAKVVTSALNSAPNLSEQILLQLAAISQGGHLGVEDLCLDRCEKEHGITPSLAYGRALKQFVAGKPQDGLNQFAALRQKKATDRPLDWDMAEARYRDLIGDSQAHAKITVLADANPDNLRVQQLLLSARSTRTDKDALARAISRERQLTGEGGLGWRTSKARWLIDFDTSDAGLNEAIGLLSDVTRLSPDLLDARYLLGRAYEAVAGRAKSEAERVTRLSSAVNELSQASSLAPGSASISLYLAKLLQSRGDFEQARMLLARITDDQLPDAQQRIQAAALLEQQGDSGRAIQLADEAIRQNVDDLTSSLLLANLYRQRNQPQRAAEIVERLLASKPNLQVILFAADLYAAQGNMTRANQVLGRLEELQLDPGIRELAEGDFQIRYSDMASAMEYYRAGIKLAPKTPSGWKALIASYFAQQQPREALAANDQAFRECATDPAFAAIKQNGQMLSTACADETLRPIVVAFVRNAADAAAAGETLRATPPGYQPGATTDWAVWSVRLEPVANTYPRFLPLQALLANTYVKQERYDDASKIAMRATQLSPSDPEPLRLAATIFAAAGHWPEAIQTAKDWRERSLANPRDADLALAEAYLQSNRPSDAVKQLRPYIAGAPADAARGGAIITLYSKAQKQLGLGDTATLMEPLLHGDTRGRLTWISFAVDNLDEPEARVWLTRAAAEMSAIADDEHLALAQGWADLYKKFKSPDLADNAFSILKVLTDRKVAGGWIVAGLLHEEMNDPHEAEAAYRAALKLQPNHPVALNNLAMVLARNGGDLNEARMLAQASVQQNRVTPTCDPAALYDTLAFVQGKAGMFDEAVSASHLAIKQQPGNVEFQIDLARLLLDANRRDEAIATLKKIESMQPESRGLADSVMSQLQSLRKSLGTATPREVSLGR